SVATQATLVGVVKVINDDDQRRIYQHQAKVETSKVPTSPQRPLGCACLWRIIDPDRISSSSYSGSETKESRRYEQRNRFLGCRQISVCSSFAFCHHCFVREHDCSSERRRPECAGRRHLVIAQ